METKVSIREGLESMEREVSAVLALVPALDSAEALALATAIHQREIEAEAKATVAVQVTYVVPGGRVVSELLLVEASAPQLVKDGLLVMARKASPALWSEILTVLVPAGE